MHISFCGCGFLGIYHIGVIKALLQNGKSFVSQINLIGGASAGALAGAVLLCEPHKVEECKQLCLELAKDVRQRPIGALTPAYSILDPVREFVDNSLSIGAYKKANGRLHISLTTLNKFNFPVNKVVSSYSSDEELRETLLTSCFIPGYVGYKFPRIQNKIHWDGGLTNNLVVFKDGHTVTVSPFCGGQDISPVDPEGRRMYFRIKNQRFQFNKHNGLRAVHGFFPPSDDILLKYYDMGFNNALEFLKREGLLEDG